MARKGEMEEENMYTALLTAFVVLSMTCLKHFSSLSYLIEQWRSLVFLLLNVLLLSVYFTSTRPISSKTRPRGKLGMMREKKNNKTRAVDERSDFFVVEPEEVIKNCVVEETINACPECEETVKHCLFPKKAMYLDGEDDGFEPLRLSNEELNERVEAFITTFRQHLVRDARRGKNRETHQKLKTKDSKIICSIS